MSRYIDADKLYEDMQWSIQHDMYDKPFDYLAEIDCQPTADVRENVRGEWKKRKDKPLQNWYQCSNCGAICGETPKYCSECGADMRGDNNGKRNDS